MPKPTKAIILETKPIKIVVGFAPGGSVDALARLTGDALRQEMKSNILIENKPGAAGRLAVDYVKSAVPDGNTLLLVPQGPITMFPFVFRKLNYDPNRDFIPVTRIATGDFALAVGPLAPVKDLAGFREWLKTAGAKASFGSPGSGTVPHFVGSAAAKALGTPMTHVPYRGSALSINDLAGGNLAATVSPLTEAMELHKAGRIRILAITGSVRTPFLAGIPTFKEAGMDVDAPLWFALYAPAATPSSVIDAMRTALQKSLMSHEFKDKFSKLGLCPAPTSSAEQLVLQRRETEMWGPIIKASGFTPED
jgi:tripartite-type tricarboxylate transporter receptor subunit TctC